MKFGLYTSTRKLEAVIERAPKQEPLQGNTYNNCAFGAPFPINVPQQRFNGTAEGAVRHAVTQTGIPKELVQRAWESIRQYFEDKNKL